MSNQTTYKDSGVDVSAGNDAVSRIKDPIKSTHTPFVITELGTFGALYDFGAIAKRFHHPILVQSIDSVGTKLMIANMMHSHRTIGADMVAHSCNDILCQGAEPLTFLDYIAVDRLDPQHIEHIVEGITNECKSCGMAVVGGEVAELPGVYASGEYDLVGAVTGVVEKDNIILGKDICSGDILIGLDSSGLHTNGYSLARKVLFSGYRNSVETIVPEIGCSLGEELLKPHRNYSVTIRQLMERIKIKGIAHITGGGLIENVPRILPTGFSAVIDKASWEIPPIFKFIQQTGNVPEEDIFRTLNMGIGLVIVISPENESTAVDFLNSSPCPGRVIGEVCDGSKGVIWKK